MTTKKKASTAAKVSRNPKSAAASALTMRSAKSRNVTPKSGQVISRTVAIHRDALKRLADR